MADKTISIFGCRMAVVCWNANTSHWVSWRCKEMGLSLFAMAIFSILIVTTLKQIRVWKNDITLYRHALDVTDNNYVAHNNLAFLQQLA
jgi:hypothetical protein